MKKIIALMITVLIAGCQQVSEGQKDQLIVYLENEDGVDPYKTRIIVSAKFIRFDEGDNSNTFLLFDRTSKIAHSVNHEMKSTMIVQGKQIEVEAPIELKHTVKIIDDIKDAPKLAGVTPVHRQHSTNDQVCFDVISADGLMTEAVKAMIEFHEVLASDSASTFNIMPADMLDPCAISMSTFVPTRHLQHGFPVREWKPGYARTLVDFQSDYKADAGLFVLPNDYFSYSVQEFREGRVDLMNQKIFAVEKSDSTTQDGKKSDE